MHFVSLRSAGTLEPVAWSRGFAASAAAVTRDFVSSRSLQQIKAVVLGPPGGYQSHVCKQARPALAITMTAWCIRSPQHTSYKYKKEAGCSLLTNKIRFWRCAHIILRNPVQQGAPTCVFGAPYTRSLFARREKRMLQISQRYGLLHVDAKSAVDGVFEALAKPLPPPVSAEEKAPPAAKGKKAKDTKKGTSDSTVVNVLGGFLSLAQTEKPRFWSWRLLLVGSVPLIVVCAAAFMKPARQELRSTPD